MYVEIFEPDKKTGRMTVQDLAPAIASISLFAAVGWIVKLVLENRLRRLMIEKNLLGADLKLPAFESAPRDVGAWLRWGIVLVGFGCGLMLLEPFAGLSEAFRTGVVVLAIGLATVVAYAVSRRLDPTKPPAE